MGYLRGDVPHEESQNFWKWSLWSSILTFSHHNLFTISVFVTLALKEEVDMNLSMSEQLLLPIGNVANWKCHQWLDEILIFFFYPHYNGEISKVVFKKTLSCNTPAKLNTILFAQHTLAVMQVFHAAKACYKCTRFWHSFLTNNFADFLYSAGKNNQNFVQSLVAF